MSGVKEFPLELWKCREVVYVDLDAFLVLFRIGVGLWRCWFCGIWDCEVKSWISILGDVCAGGEERREILGSLEAIIDGIEGGGFGMGDEEVD